MKETPTPSKRQLLLAGLIVLIVVLFAFVSITVATSSKASPAQTFETEPNNDFESANLVHIDNPVMGSAWNSVTDTDYFVMETTIGEKYLADIILYSDDLTLRMLLYDGEQNFVTASSFSSSYIVLQWSAYTTTYYIQVAAAILTETIQTAEYRLEVLWVAPTPTPTPFEINLPVVLKSAGWVESQIAPTLSAESNGLHIGER